MSEDLITRVELACIRLVEEGSAVTFADVALYAKTAKATLYRRPELRAVVEEHRRGAREAHSFSAIVIELDHLRQGLEVIASKVRRNEEELQTLRRKVLRQK